MTSEMMDDAIADNPIERIKRAWFEVRKIEPFMVAEIHLTYDFFMRMKAHRDFADVADILNIRHDHAAFTILGLPKVMHAEKCEEDFWFADPVGKKIGDGKA